VHRIDLWICADADATPQRLAASRDWLAPDEHARWRRFLREDDRRRFLLARGLVRGVLARCTGVAPAALEFEAQVHGKPALAGALRASGWEFNLSHTRGMVALAVSRGVEVGVDVEAIDRRLDPLRLAARNFSPHERAALEATADAARPARFFDLWTLKEAYVKALGCGLQHDLRAFSVSFDAGAPAILEHADGVERASACSCWLDEPAPGFRLALVARDVPAIDVHVVRGFPPVPA